MCIILVSQQGKMTSNSQTIARNFNAVVEFKWCAVRPNFIMLWVYSTTNNNNMYMKKALLLFASAK